jgi:CRISPR/Cas system-associated exonuclease Cas4 (RecB family)
MPFLRNTKLFNPESKSPFRISRSKIDLYLECPRCFYLDQRLGINRPSWPAFSLNLAVDALLKNEFDLLRKNGQKHELMEKYGVDAIPFKHKDLPVWRNDDYQFKGAFCLHAETNLIISGIIDDIWINPQEELMIVDYKSTSTTKEISLEDEYKQKYKRQVELYQWIFKQKGFKVATTSYFVFANAGSNRPKFDGKLEFELTLVPHQGDLSWIEPTLKEIKTCLNSQQTPPAAAACEHCAYRKSVFTAILKSKKEK